MSSMLKIEYLNSDHKYHNDNGPAKIYECGCKIYYKNGELHRDDGPALDNCHRKEWWVVGKKMSEEEFNKRKIVRNRSLEGVIDNIENMKTEELKIKIAMMQRELSYRIPQCSTMLLNTYYNRYHIGKVKYASNKKNGLWKVSVVCPKKIRYNDCRIPKSLKDFVYLLPSSQRYKDIKDARKDAAERALKWFNI